MSESSSPESELDQLLKAAQEQFPAGSPVMMLNLLRYREVADEIAEDGAPRRSGRQAYFESYLPAFRRVAEAAGVPDAEVTFAGQVQANLLAPAGEVIDDVAIVRYPSFAAFRRIATSEGYRLQAEPLRHAALAELRLYATSPFNPTTASE